MSDVDGGGAVHVVVALAGGLLWFGTDTLTLVTVSTCEATNITTSGFFHYRTGGKIQIQWTRSERETRTRSATAVHITHHDSLSAAPSRNFNNVGVNKSLVSVIANWLNGSISAFDCCILVRVRVEPAVVGVLQSISCSSFAPRDTERARDTDSVCQGRHSLFVNISV